MRSLVRQVLLLAVAGLVSWWVLLRQPPGPRVPILPPPRTTLIAVTPEVEPPPEPDPAEPNPAKPNPAKPDAAKPAAAKPTAAKPTAAKPDPQPVAEAAPPAPPPPERGTPEGKAGGTAPVAPAPEAPTDPATLMKDPDLLRAAREEMAGEARKGFQTVFLAVAEDQLDIADFFGEALVLVPRSALDPSNAHPRYYRLTGGPRPVVETVEGRPQLDAYRQYRDLFDYDYARLPAPVRALRRSVLVRGEVFVFAALIPVVEWSVVVARRREALAAAGRDLAAVRRLTLRYERRPDGAFDIRVAEIQFADGQRFRPVLEEGASRR